jgi:hypothetical protein
MMMQMFLQQQEMIQSVGAAGVVPIDMGGRSVANIEVFGTPYTESARAVAKLEATDASNKEAAVPCMQAVALLTAVQAPG